MRKFYKDGEMRCAGCGDALPPFLACTKGPFVCRKADCQKAGFDPLASRRYVAKGEIMCQNPGCSRPVPEGWYGREIKVWTCGSTCFGQLYRSRHVAGICLYCEGPIHDNPYMEGTRKFCCTDHRLRYYGVKRLESRTGEFAPILKQYLAGFAKTHYARRSYDKGRTQLIMFLEFLRLNGIRDLEDVKPSTITDYIVHVIDRGVRDRSYVGFISTFFQWLCFIGIRKSPSPVIPRFHRSPSSQPAPRPFDDATLETIWTLLEERGTELDRLAVAIGEECGLRVGEVGNIRLSDLDQAGQTILVRLPTKNRSERRPYYHEKVKRYLEEWLKVRDPYCGHDHLLHRPNGSAITYSGYLQTRLRDLLCKGRDYETGIDSFSFHRLRHTWATRLAEAGMETAVLMQLGGWKTLSSAQIYIEVSQAHKERSYHAAVTRMREDQQNAAETSVSLADLALMDGTEGGSGTHSGG
jgi:integrase